MIQHHNHRAIPLETLEKALEYYELTIDDISDKLVQHEEDEDDLDDLIGGLDE